MVKKTNFHLNSHAGTLEYGILILLNKIPVTNNPKDSAQTE